MLFVRYWHELPCPHRLIYEWLDREQHRIWYLCADCNKHIGVSSASTTKQCIEAILLNFGEQVYIYAVDAN